LVYKSIIIRVYYTEEALQKVALFLCNKFNYRQQKSLQT